MLFRCRLAAWRYKCHPLRVTDNKLSFSAEPMIQYKTPPARLVEFSFIKESVIYMMVARVYLLTQIKESVIYMMVGQPSSTY